MAGLNPPPHPPTRDPQLEKKCDPNSQCSIAIKNIRESATAVDMLYRFLCTTPSFPVTCEIDALGKEIEGSRKTYLKLALDALAVAEALKKAGVQEGDRVALLFLGGTEIFPAYYGAMLIGVIPVVLPPPIKLAADLPKFNPLIKAMDIKFILSHKLYYQHSTMQTVSHKFSSIFKTEVVSWPSHLKWLYVEEMVRSSPYSFSFSSSSTDADYEKVKETFYSYSKKIKSNHIAYLQLTSGSTSHPKAVIIPHSSLILSITKLLMIPYHTGTVFYLEQQNRTSYTAETFAHPTKALVDPLAEEEEGRSVIAWVPAYHDFYWGMLGAAQLFGQTFIVMSALDFLGRPACWLECCYRFRAQFVFFSFSFSSFSPLFL